MSEGIIRINTVSLGNDAQTISDALGRMNSAANQMESIKSVLDAMWDGPASEKFKTAWGKDIQDLIAMIEELRADFYKYEMNAKSKYKECDKNVVSIISSLNV